MKQKSEWPSPFPPDEDEARPVATATGTFTVEGK